MNFEKAQVIRVEKEDVACFVCEHCQREIKKLVTLRDDKGETIGVGVGCAKSLHKSLAYPISRCLTHMKNKNLKVF